MSKTKATPKIAFIWYFEKATWVFPNWRDGHRRAIEEIGKKHEVDWFLNKELPEIGKYDFLLFWSSSQEDFFPLLERYKTEKKGICLTTNPHNPDNLRKMDVIFVESDPVYNEVRTLGLPVIKAFGTDTDFFKPSDVKKDIDYFYPATFSPWKRQRDIAYLGKKLLCVGTVQPDGQEDYQACEKAGVQLEIGYFPAIKILSYYQRAKNVIIPAVHGSERTVLEAMACDIIPEINKENKKALSYFDEFRNSDFESPRDFILANYSHKIFAENLLKGIER